MAAGDPVPRSLYIYAPNQGAPIFFTIAFAISAVFHIWQCFRYKAFRLIGLHPICAVLFTVGYALREWGSYHYLFDPADRTPLVTFIVSQVFIYVCPPLLELSNYHILARLFSYIPHCAPIPPSSVLSTFGGLMAIVELLNSLGVSFSANPSSSTKQQTLGGQLTIAAVSIQLGIITVFVGLAVIFQRRCAAAARERGQQTGGGKKVRTMLWTLYGSMGLILVRCVYRLVEHAGYTHIEFRDIEALKRLSPLVRYEAFFYVFEASLMLVNSVVWNVWHPGRFLPRDGVTYLEVDGTEARRVKRGENWASVVWMVANIATFGVLGLVFPRRERNEEAHELRGGSQRSEAGMI
ncbi:uncharacterized protein C8A04DRAFT_31472 [Dichotomopilus funicola]|uniref:RTA1 domain protein n=1 Tax=Dichotomopilus funicola TaxID=1934379 RepID=A0AAN6UXC8_9PEZI|nr:hypothetical protein C8A04DRAFT_31472 [Dichotomopilus funicola]